MTRFALNMSVLAIGIIGIAVATTLEAMLVACDRKLNARPNSL